ncbi:hypothetical protein SRHO_G00000710 [Serrasalmus rhombeus]
MSEFLADPSVLTKDKLKSALVANNVALPNGEQRKGVYVELYLKNLTSQNKKSSAAPAPAPTPDAFSFSSDEELPAPVVSNKSRSGRKATRKTDRVRPEEIDVTELTNEGLKDQLLKYGINAGPIVVSTRKVYEKKLQKLLDLGPPEAVIPLSEPARTDSSQNGNTDSDQYSDKEEETPTAVPEPEPEPEPEPDPVPVVERPLRSRGKTPVTARTRSGQHKTWNEDEQEEDFQVMNVQRKSRRSSRRLDQTVPASDDTVTQYIVFTCLASEFCALGWPALLTWGCDGMDLEVNGTRLFPPQRSAAAKSGKRHRSSHDKYLFSKCGTLSKFAGCPSSSGSVPKSA